MKKRVPKKLIKIVRERGLTDEDLDQILRENLPKRGPECPNDESMFLLSKGDLDEKKTAEIMPHIASCKACGLLLKMLKV